MKYTNTDSVEKKFYDAEGTLPCIWESEAAKVFFQVYAVTNQIIDKIEQDINN